jgi:acetyl esterase
MRYLILILCTVFTLRAADKPFTMPGLQQDIEFAKSGDVSLTLDAFVPEGAGPFATCILVHGGGFTKGDKHSFLKPLFEPLSKAGFTWFTINYRLAPQHAWPACADDVASAIKWVKAHAAEYKVDPKRIALIGESAGGHLVSWTGVMGAGDTRVAAVVPFYAPHDLVVQVQRRNALGGLGGLIGTEELNDAALKKLADISPLNHIKPGLPPFLQIHGDKDETVPLSQSLNFATKMKAAGNSCETIIVPGGIHGMGGWQKLGSDYQEQMIAWLRQTLK